MAERIIVADDDESVLKSAGQLSGTSIPEEARIIAVADAYDVMTSRRSYRKALPQDAVRPEIEKGAGTQFDPQFAEIMLRIIDEDTNYTYRE